MSPTDLPIVLDTLLTGDRGVALVHSVVNKMRHLFRPTERHDVGIDGQIEIVQHNEGERSVATGKLIGVQIRCGESYLRERADSYVVYCTSAQANYWENYSLPVIFVVCDPTTQNCYWVRIDRSSLSRTEKGPSVVIPKSNNLSEAESKLIEIASDYRPSAALGAAKTFIIPFDRDCRLAMTEEDLQALCGEIALAASRSNKFEIEISLDEEALIAAQIADIELGAEKMAAQRMKIVQLEEMLDALAFRRTRTERGIKLLLADDRIRGSYLMISHFVDAAIAIRRFARTLLPEQDFEAEKTALSLVAFPSPSRQEPIVYIDLDQEERATFLASRDLQGSVEPLRWAGFNVSDIEDGVIRRKVLPAVVRTLIAYSDRKGLSDADVLSDIDLSVFAWTIGLA